MWGRLKGGHPVCLGVTLKRVLVLNSETADNSICVLLFAGVLAAFGEFKPDRGDSITTRSEMFTREIPLFAAQSSHRNGALRLQEPHTEATRRLGESLYRYGCDPASNPLR